MANTVLQFRSGSQARDRLARNLEVYIDIDKDSMLNSNYKLCCETMLSDYAAYLSTENGNAPSDSGYVCPQPNSVSAGEYVTDDADGRTVSAFGVVLSAGFDEKYALYQKYMTPYRYRVSKLVNVNAVQNSLHQIFTWIPGERVINPEFGSRLQAYLYEGITEQNIEAIVSEIRQCVTKWEPRVVVDKVVNVQSVEYTENNTVRIDVLYHIIGLDDEQFRYTYKYNRTSV